MSKSTFAGKRYDRTVLSDLYTYDKTQQRYACKICRDNGNEFSTNNEQIILAHIAKCDGSGRV